MDCALRGTKIGSDTTSPLSKLVCGSFVGLEIDMRERVEAFDKISVAAGCEKAVTIVQTGNAFVKSRKLAGEIVDLLAIKTVGVCRQIEGPACEAGDRLSGVSGTPVGVGK